MANKKDYKIFRSLKVGSIVYKATPQTDNKFVSIEKVIVESIRKKRAKNKTTYFIHFTDNSTLITEPLCGIAIMGCQFEYSPCLKYLIEYFKSMNYEVDLEF